MNEIDEFDEFDIVDSPSFSRSGHSVCRSRGTYNEVAPVVPDAVVPDAVSDKNIPPPKKELTLSQRQYMAETKAQRLQGEIDNCRHQWVEGDARMETDTYDLGESIGESTDWVLCQHRDCSVCGSYQKRTKYRPNWEWSDWDEDC